MQPGDEFRRLQAVEYGNGVEIAFRGFVALGGGLILFAYTHQFLALAWFCGYCGMHLVYALFLRAAIRHPSQQRLTLSALIYLGVAASYLWLPVYLMSYDSVALRVPAMLAMGGFLIFLIRRADGMALLLSGEIVLVLAAGVGVLIGTLGQIDRPLAKGVMVLSVLGFVVYFGQALFAARRQRLQAAQAAEASVQARKMEAIGKLAGGVAHDFNNILTVILGNLDLHELTDSPAERREMLGQIRGAANRGAETVRQLLSYARSAQLSSEPRNIARIVARTAALARPLLTPAITLERHCESSAPMARVDESHLTTALLNLVINARDAIAGAGTIWIECSHVVLRDPVRAHDGGIVAPGGYAMVTVRDDGPGIAPEILSRVAEPFFTTKPLGEGTGLGLAMVAGFAHQSGGHLMIESLEHGTAVSLLLPLVTDEAEDAAPPPLRS